MSEQKYEHLQRGGFAPDFSAPDLTGQRFQLSELNSRGVWLAFYRYASCPMCNTHFDDVLSWRKLLAENDIEFIAIFESYKENFPARFLENKIRDVKVVADPKNKLYDVYGVNASWKGYLSPQPFIERAKAATKGYVEGKIDGRLDRLPAHFLLLPGGLIHQARYGKNIADHLKWRDLQSYFDTLKGLSQQTVPWKPEITFINDGVGNYKPEDDKTEVIKKP